MQSMSDKETAAWLVASLGRFVDGSLLEVTTARYSGDAYWEGYRAAMCGFLQYAEQLAREITESK